MSRQDRGHIALHAVTDLKSCRAVITALKGHFPNLNEVVLPDDIWRKVLAEASHIDEAKFLIVEGVHIMHDDIKNCSFFEAPFYNWKRGLYGRWETTASEASNLPIHYA